jgi:aminoglycoside 3-N-acetyltransferase
VSEKILRRIPPAGELILRGAFYTRQRLFPARERRPARRTPPTDPVPASEDQLAQTLAALDIERGDVLMVHSDSGAIERLGWEIPLLIDWLINYLGPEGTLAMPTHVTLRGKDGRPVYNVRRSPSTVGLMTEVFRRRKGVLRSRFPVSPAAAIGHQAETLIVDHSASRMPHDGHSPYAKLAELGGKALCIGCALDRMTIIHVAEDAMGEAMPIAGFYDKKIYCVIDGDEKREVAVQLRADWLWWYLAKYRWTHDMLRRGFAKESSLNGVMLRSADARAVVEWMKGQLSAGRSIYPLAKLNSLLRLSAPPKEWR